jgi:hypothetical protein
MVQLTMRWSCIIGLISVTATTAQAQTSAPARTTVRDAAALRQLLGQHKLSLQWISWKRFGRATVSDRDGVLELRGEQQRGGGRPGG